MSNQIADDETTKDDTPTVNGVELDSVVGVANALAYLDEPLIHLQCRTRLRKTKSHSS